MYFLKNNAEKLCGEKITVAGRKMFISDVQIAHALRKFKKDQGKSVSIHDIIDIQKNIKHSTVYFDIRHKNILFLFQKKDKSIIKYCFDINYKLRGNSSAIYFITAGKINKTDIENNTKNYIEIKDDTITIQANSNVVINCQNAEVNADENITLNCQTAEITADNQVNINATNINLGENASLALVNEKITDILNSHTHNYTNTAGTPTPTTPPNVPFVSTQYTNANIKESV